MLKILKATSVWLIGLSVVAALAVGTRTAFARPVSAMCTDDGWVHLGSCTSNMDCYNKCAVVHGPDVVGHCDGGCCLCLF